ncbi:outer membrane lipoprotein-sorting protein [Vibrio atypicus]|uniref:outer membrane lipoprotein-sorting protein n=1 Tax=Vibrio atypicus TaxID=558271 RepID=UPI003735315F
MFNTMKGTLLITLSLFGFSGSVFGSEESRDVASMVVNADNYRQGYDAAKVVSKVQLFEHAKLDKTREYHVYTRLNRESLVVFKSQVEEGQKMLMLGDNYWLLMPKSRRPIRITPMQKLLGEASVGDISTLTWSEDYHASLVDTEELDVESNAVLAHKLRLRSTTKGASYNRIDLWLDTETDFPLKADLYLRSGKLAKQALFQAGELNGEKRVVSMVLLDKIQPAKKTVISYQEITPFELEDKYYNPAYLTRNVAAEL